MDRISEGRSFRMLTLIDVHSGECLASDVARRRASEDVLERLSDLFVRRARLDVHCLDANAGQPR